MDLSDDSTEADVLAQARRASERPQPIEGEVVPLSHTTAYFFVFGCVIGCAVGVVQLGAWCWAMFLWIADGGAFRGFQGFLLGACELGLSAGYGYVLFIKVCRGRRLVIGHACVQMLEGSDDDTCVLASIPYANLEAVRCTRVDFGYRLDFELVDVHDPTTYLPGVAVEPNYLTHKYHFAVTESYRESMEWLRAEIRAARKRWRKKNPKSAE